MERASGSVLREGVVLHDEKRAGGMMKIDQKRKKSPNKDVVPSAPTSDTILSKHSPHCDSPPPYSPFYSEPENGERRYRQGSSTANVNVYPADGCPPIPFPRRSAVASADRRIDSSVFLSPLILSSQLQTIPLTVENPQCIDEDVVKERSHRGPLDTFKSLDHVQLSRASSGDFVLRSAKGEILLTASDEVGCAGTMFGDNKPFFDITVVDAAFTQVLTVKRPFTCNSCAFPTCLPRVSVATPSEGIIGVVKRRWAAFDQHLTIHDVMNGSTSAPLYHIRRRQLPLVARNANEFKIFNSAGKVQIGKFHSRLSTSFSQKQEEDRLAVSFPKSLDARVKATLVGSLFLIRELYFKP